MEPNAFGSAHALAAAMRGGKLSASAVVATYLQRIGRFNPAINAILHVQAEAAVARAADADAALARGESWGPLHGVPITVKDSFDVAGLPSTFGLEALRHNVPTRHALAVDRLLGAGAILLGKTNVPPSLADWQSSNPIYGTTRNPWDLERSPGGSSGGAAAALAAGMTALEIGSDIGGSIRMPAHFCGVFGHKPSFGLVPGRGHATPGRTAPSDIGVYGPMARSAGDLDLALSILAGPDAEAGVAWRLDQPAPVAPDGGWRIAVMATDADFPVDSDTTAALRAAAEALRRAGARVEEVVGPGFPSRDAYEIYVLLLRAATSARQSPAEYAANLAAAAALSPDDGSYLALLLRGNTLSHRDWHAVQQRRHDLIAAWAAFFGRFDALLCPVASTPAFPMFGDVPKHARQVMVDDVPRPSANDYFWHGLASASYLPATTVPLALSSAGLPIGGQIIGPFGQDRRCIALARMVEERHRGFVAPPGYA